MRTIVFYSLFTTVAIWAIKPASAQQDFGSKKSSDTSNQIDLSYQKKAEFPGGEEALYAYITRNVRVDDCLFDCYHKTRFFLAFVVEKDGSVSDVRIDREELSPYSSSDKIKVAREKLGRKGRNVPDDELVFANCEDCLDILRKNAMDVMRKMPAWEPAISQEKLVRMRYRLPITFTSN